MNRYFAIFFAAAAMAFATPGATMAAVSNQQPEAKILTVQESVRMALARSPEVLLAEAQAIRTREAVRETRSLNSPQVYTGTGLAYNNGYPLSMEGAAPSIFQVSGTQEIFSKKNSNLIREAEQSGKASLFGADSARNEIAAKTALAYFQLFQSGRKIAIATRRIDLAQKLQQQVETLYAAERVRPVDVTIAKTATLAARQQLLVAQEQAKLAETELRELTGFPDPIRTVEPRIDSPLFNADGATIYRQSLECTPEILQAEANVKAKEFHVEAERGDRLPKLQIVGEYALFAKVNNYQDFFNKFTRNNFLLGLSLQVPVFNGPRTSARVAQSRQEASEARYRLEGLKSDLKLAIERSLSAFRIARAESDFARSDLQAAREMVQVNEALLEGGRIGPKDMEDSRSLLQQKELVLLEADQGLFQRELDLLRVAGTLPSMLQ